MTTSMTIRNAARRAAFSLVELLVVIVVIGILAAVVIPNTISAGDTARVTATMEDLNSLVKAVENYRNKTGKWPRNAANGTMPTELSEYFTKSNPFQKTVPIGGLYDYDGSTSNHGPRIRIVGSPGNPIADVATLTELDEQIDDGSLATGRMRKPGGAIEFYIQPGD